MSCCCCPQLKCQFLEQAQSAATAIRVALQQSALRKPYMTLLNPYGGAGRAPHVWRKLEPLLAFAGIEVELVVTTHAGHAKELAQSIDYTKYTAIISVSGDGLVNEIVNGLMARADAADAVSALPIAPAPGGTGNGLHKSICHKAGEAHDLIGTAFVIAKGQAAPLDLWEYVQPASPEGPERPLLWSMLSFAWGMITDVDIESEVCRGCGPLRTTLYGLLRIAGLRRYTGKLEYLDAASGSWETLESSDWVGLWACNVTHMAADALPAPDAQMTDGCVDVIILRGRQCTRMTMLQMFLAVETGDHVNLQGGLTIVKAKSFRFYPQPRTPSKPGILAIDGELVDFGNIEARPHPGKLRILSPPSGASP